VAWRVTCSETQRKGRKERCTKSLAVALLSLARCFLEETRGNAQRSKQPRPKQAAGAGASSKGNQASSSNTKRAAREFTELDNHLVFHHFPSTTTPNFLYDCALAWLSSPTPSPAPLHFRRDLCPAESVFSTRAAPPSPASTTRRTLCLSEQTHARVETQALLPTGSAPYFTPAATTTHPRRTLPPTMASSIQELDATVQAFYSGHGEQVRHAHNMPTPFPS
jgi:hypothetical protein